MSLAAATLALTPGIVPAQDTASACDIRDAQRQLEQGRSTLDETTLAAARKTFEACTRNEPNHSLGSIGLTRADLYLVDARDRRHDKAGAERAVDAGIDDARRAITIDDKSAEAHALLADLYGRKIGYGGMLTGMRYGPKAESEVNRALALDSTNAHAYLVLGRRYLYAPRMFGGNVDKAVETFRKATTLDPRSDEALVWLATAYAKKGDAAAERTSLDEALRLNAANVVAMEMRSSLK